MANRLAEFETPPGAWWPTGERVGSSGGVQEQLESHLAQAAEWIKQHPEIALTSAVVTGVVLGWFIKRR
jgi:ElaB/YqjD/DUF883 family membrane-anchored ribosome-binding protein